MKNKCLNLTKLWAVVRAEGAEEIKPYLAAKSEYMRVSLDVASILDTDYVDKKSRDVQESTCAAEILENHSKLVDALHLQDERGVAQFTANRLLKLERAKIFATVPAILEIARKVAGVARDQIADAEERFCSQFSVPVRESHLASFVEQFEREISSVELQMKIFSHVTAPPNIPNLFWNLEEPIPPAPPAPPFPDGVSPKSRSEVRAIVVQRSMAEKRADQAHEELQAKRIDEWRQRMRPERPARTNLGSLTAVEETDSE